MSYKLDLPPDSRLHPTFHVSCLKSKFGQHAVSLPSLPYVDSEGIISPERIVVLQERTHQLRHRTITQVLVQWQGVSKEDATWENLFLLQQQFPHLVGKVLFFFFLWGGGEGGRELLLRMILQ